MTDLRPPVGTRVRAIRFHTTGIPAGGSKDAKTGMIFDADGEVISVDDNVTVPPGTEGTIVVSDPVNLGVHWDNGAKLGLIADDEWAPTGKILISIDDMADLIDANIELLSQYKLDYPQDYLPADVERMKGEIGRLESLRESIMRIRTDIG